MKVLIEWGNRNLKGRYCIKARTYAGVKKFLQGRPNRQACYLGIIHEGSITYEAD